MEALLSQLICHRVVCNNKDGCSSELKVWDFVSISVPCIPSCADTFHSSPQLFTFVSLQKPDILPRYSANAIAQRTSATAQLSARRNTPILCFRKWGGGLMITKIILGSPSIRCTSQTATPIAGQSTSWIAARIQRTMILSAMSHMLATSQSSSIRRISCSLKFTTITRGRKLD